MLSGLFLLSGCASFRACEDDWFGPDKQQHLAASAALGAGFTLLALDERDDTEAFALGLAASTAIGTGKEWHDLAIKKTCWSWRDLVWDVLGASLGASAALAVD